MTEKIEKSAVDYGPGHPRGDRCAVCRHFEPPHACEIVAGEIGAGMWCKRFERQTRRQRLYRRAET